jgi:hypothetical protein
MLHHRVKAVLCQWRDDLLREHFLQLHPKVLHDRVHGILCAYRAVLLREHFVHFDPKVLQ